MEENVVEIYNLCKTYKNTNAVSHLHMEIKKAKFMVSLEKMVLVNLRL